MTPAIDITAEQRRTVLALLERHLPDTAVWACGNRVKGVSCPASDLDLVVFARPEQSGQVAELREAFEESNLPFRVDLFVWDEAPESFRMRIEAEHVALVSPDASCAIHGWRMMSFSNAILLNPSIALESGETYPFVEMAAIDAGSRCVYAIQQREYSGGGSRFCVGDTLMARITPCLENGKIARYCGFGASEFAHGSTEFLVIRGRPDVTDTEFAYYLTKWNKVCDYAIGQMTGTSGRQRVPTDSLSRLTVPIPPIQEQRAIAHILGTLDDKIELNRRMNETLEAMARALFQSWFVDFDPVRAKMEGRDTGLPQPIADLFPDRLVDSESGEIPAGWTVHHLEDCFEIVMGQSPPGHTYNDTGDGLPFFQGRSDFGFRYPRNRKFCTAPNRIAEPEDTLLSVRAPVGDINMAWEQCCIGRGIAALRYRARAASFTYYTMQSLQVHLRGYENTGTVFGAITRTQLAKLPIQHPSMELVHAFERLARGWDETIRRNTAQINTLAALRGVLLPRLVSGRLRTRDATRFAGRTA